MGEVPAVSRKANPVCWQNSWTSPNSRLISMQMNGMTEAQWNRSSDPQAMLTLLRDSRRVSERKLRLFGVACCRGVWTHFTDDRCRMAVEVVERYADGLATPQEMDQAWHGVNTARDLVFGPQSTAPRRHRSHLGRTTSWAAYALVNIPPEGPDALGFVWRDVEEAAAYARDIPGRIRALKAFQVRLLRCIFGNPFRPIPPLLKWHDGTVVKLAQAAYEERSLPSGTLDPVRLGILADALEESGLADADLVRHLRDQGPHYRGCHGTDLVLGLS